MSFRSSADILSVMRGESVLDSIPEEIDREDVLMGPARMVISVGIRVLAWTVSLKCKYSIPSLRSKSNSSKTGDVLSCVNSVTPLADSGRISVIELFLMSTIKFDVTVK